VWLQVAFYEGGTLGESVFSCLYLHPQALHHMLQKNNIRRIDGALVRGADQHLGRFQAIFTTFHHQNSCLFPLSPTTDEGCCNGVADEEGPELSSPVYALMAVVFGVFKAIHFFRKVRHIHSFIERFSKGANLNWVSDYSFDFAQMQGGGTPWLKLTWLSCTFG
jgi:hypothetical protein